MDWLLSKKPKSPVIDLAAGVPTIGSILKFESKSLMSGQTSCIASILKLFSEI